MYIYLNRILTPNDTISGKSFLLTFGNKVLFCQVFFFLFEFLFSSKQEARKGFVVRRDSYMKLIKTKQQTIRKSKLKKKWKSVIVNCLFESCEGRDNIGIWIPSTGFQSCCIPASTCISKNFSDSVNRRPKVFVLVPNACLRFVVSLVTCDNKPPLLNQFRLYFCLFILVFTVLFNFFAPSLP